MGVTKLKKKFWIIGVIIIVIVFLMAYTSTVPFLFKANYGISIPYPIVYQSYFNEHGRDPSYLDVLIFQEDLNLKNSKKFQCIIGNSKIWTNILNIYINGETDEKKQVILEKFPFDIIKDGNFVYIQQTGNRMSILIYDTKNRTLYRLSQVIFLHDELAPYSDYVTVTKEPIFD